MIESAGLLILYNNKMLLAHPTKSPWYGTYTIPKGKLEENETTIEAAIRETKEEIGIDIDINIVEPTPYIINYIGENGQTYKSVVYYVVRLENEIPKKDFILDEKEVNWVGFLNKFDARGRIFWRFEEMLNFLD